jgi:AraC-like DNA-binding protein
MQEETLYLILYGAAAMLSLTACCYLLLRRSNAIVPDVTSPVRLRWWTAAFFASMTLSHIWYLPTFYFTANDDKLLGTLIGATLDFLTLVPLGIVVLMSMLQDRRRPLWLAGVMMVPIIAVMTVCIANCSITLLPVVYVYYLSLGIGLIIYMVREVRQYGRWLRDNYADLEHKEVWQSFVVLAVILLFFGIYTLDPHGLAYQYATQVNNIILVCYLVWRVETLSELNVTPPATVMNGDDLPQAIHDHIGILLQQHCIDTQLYLQHDLSLLQLAKAIGTNRYYLSQYFSSQGTTYNAYINGQRIEHFMNLYHKAVATQQSFTAQQFALESGFHNYRTFSNAFKHQTGQTVTGWMKTQQRMGEC